MQSDIKRKFKAVINNPKLILIKLLYKISPLFNDEKYLKMLFPLKTGYKLNLDEPQTFNEKLQWLKLYYRKPELAKMVDKYEAKKYVSDIIGHSYIVENYGVWSSFDEIDFENLPNQYVLKTTHDQGGIVICKDKNSFNYRKARRKINKHFKIKHFYLSREWPYKNVKPRIIAEKLLVDKKKDDIWDYKFYCFNGVPKILLIATERNTKKPKFNYFDMNFDSLNFKQGGEKSNLKFEKPISFELMFDIASKLSSNLPHVRIDFYEINGKVYFGEITFFDSGGLAPFKPEKWDNLLGKWIELPKEKIVL